MTLGATFFFAMGVVWVLGQSVWHSVSSDDPRKQFVEHVGRETLLPLLRYAQRAGDHVVHRFPNRPVSGHTAHSTLPTQEARKGE